jgi:hypothetical protein
VPDAKKKHQKPELSVGRKALEQRLGERQPGWTCPECGRWFGKRQTHVCAPAMSADAWFVGRPPELRAIYDAVARHLKRLGPIHIEPVSIGFLIKKKRTIIELRPRKVGFGLSFILGRELSDPRITRRIAMSRGDVYYVVPLATANEVDAQVRGWLTEAYAQAESA